MFKLAQQNRISATIPLVALTGAIIGSAVALLLTPKKGSELRSGIKDFSMKLKSGHNNKDNGNETAEPSNNSHKATMHTVANGNLKADHTSKAAAMVNHLKQSTHPNNGHPEIL